MIFDLIISNPPYNRNIDLRILKDVHELSNKISFIHPAVWLYDNKNINKLWTHLKNELTDDFVAYEKINNANSLFNINLFGDIFITLFDKSCKTPIDIFSIDIHGDSIIYKSIKSKILSYCENNNLHKNRTTDVFPWYTGIGIVRGNPGTNDFYSLIQITDEAKHVGKTTKYPVLFGMNTLNEANNLKDYLKTKIVRFCLSIYKQNSSILNNKNDFYPAAKGSIAAVPYMPTYERDWTDEDVAKELGLTDEELKWAINWIPDYYPEDKEKYKIYK